jgi:hypothetical protein
VSLICANGLPDEPAGLLNPQSADVADLASPSKLKPLARRSRCMTSRNRSAPASAVTLTRGRDAEQLGRRLGSSNNPRNARRQRLAAHLYRCGPRPVLEALLAVESGRALDQVLEGFARLQPEIYHAVGADVLPIDQLVLLDGDRR